MAIVVAVSDFWAFGDEVTEDDDVTGVDDVTASSERSGVDVGVELEVASVRSRDESAREWLDGVDVDADDVAVEDLGTDEVDAEDGGVEEVDTTELDSTELDTTELDTTELELVVGVLVVGVLVATDVTSSDPPFRPDDPLDPLSAKAVPLRSTAPVTVAANVAREDRTRRLVERARRLVDIGTPHGRNCRTGPTQCPGAGVDE